MLFNKYSAMSWSHKNYDQTEQQVVWQSMNVTVIDKMDTKHIRI